MYCNDFGDLQGVERKTIIALADELPLDDMFVWICVSAPSCLFNCIGSIHYLELPTALEIRASAAFSTAVFAATSLRPPLRSHFSAAISPQQRYFSFPFFFSLKRYILACAVRYGSIDNHPFVNLAVSLASLLRSRFCSNLHMHLS